MVGPGAQRNKAHKAGRRAGLSAREKHRKVKDAAGRTGMKAGHAANSKAERVNTAKQLRERKRAQVLEQRRIVGAPRVVALLPLSEDVDAERLWAGLLAACSGDGDPGAAAPATPASASGMDVDAAEQQQQQGQRAAGAPPPAGMSMQTVSLPDRRRVRLTLLPPLSTALRADPLAVIELARSAEVLLLAVAGGERAEAIDGAGRMALSMLRTLGMPSVVALVQSPPVEAGSGTNLMKERSAAKKRGAAALADEIPGDHKLFAADSPPDVKQLLRHLGDVPPTVPHWRQQRPQLLVEGAEYAAGADGGEGTLLLRGYVRSLGLSANQLIHLPGAGDFQLSQIDGPPEPTPANEAAGGAAATPRGKQQQQQAGAAAMEAEAPGGGPAVLARPDPQQQEAVVRENAADPLAGEQTWPTEEELLEAEEEQRVQRATRKRRLPRGTSDYQAAWILDDSDLDETDLESEGEEGEEKSADGSRQQQRRRDGGTGGVGGAGSGSEEDEDEEMPQLQRIGGPGTNAGSLVEFDTGTEFGMDEDGEEDEDPDALAEMHKRLKQQRHAAEDDTQFPDEVDTPSDMAARERFAKYRGLASFRTSPWDPKESLPLDYSRVFAFESYRRAHKRAMAASRQAGAPGDAHGVPAGTYVQLHVAGVPAEAAARVLARVSASTGPDASPPLVASGLLQHESKLSVVHYAVRKAATYTEPLEGKEPLLFVSGLRTWVARPVYSSDETNADKYKMERFLHKGRPTVATVYGPICYPPLPLMVFKQLEGGGLALAATGRLRSCDPDRVVLKKIVLTGYPVKVHKSKAFVRFMFNNPDDVRWFKPVEVWTKQGRRGRIREPVGTHGAMKCIMDGHLKGQDAICMSLYKRVYPKWPEDMSFVA